LLFVHEIWKPPGRHRIVVVSTAYAGRAGKRKEALPVPPQAFDKLFETVLFNPVLHSVSNRIFGTTTLILWQFQ